MFKPEEIIFAPTTQCNLSCAHCSVKRDTRKLSTKYAIRFLDEIISRFGADCDLPNS
ncbi:MAG: hypothetical protein GY797_26325 [Deltaproteobacteria bacterium]|nr:hypothetical protein [Deltaproteobacteria bacterium]